MLFEEMRSRNLEETKKKLRESVNDEVMIIQFKESIDGLKKTVNILTTRFRELYACYNPEFEKELRDSEKFVELASKQKPKKDSIGGKLDKADVDEILKFCEHMQLQYKLIKELEKHLEELMKKLCPNTSDLAGISIGAELIILAGSLKRLSEMPASAIQLIGAEKALFRHIKDGAKNPKHGILFMHPLVQKAKDRGKAAKILADKISLAVKIDRFRGKYIGDKLRKNVEERIANFGARE